MCPSRGPRNGVYGYGEPDDHSDWDHREAPSGEGRDERKMQYQHPTANNDWNYKRGYDEGARYGNRSGFYDNAGGGEHERRSYESPREYEHERRIHQTRRKGSPTYEDYPARDGDTSTPSTSSPSHAAYADSYSKYRQQSEHKPPRRSASPESLNLRPPAFGLRSSPPRIVPSPPPPLPRRTEPTEEYLTTSLHASEHIEDPTSSRKLIVLDLNGSLLLRSAHQKRPVLPRQPYSSRSAKAPQPPFDPYADPTQLRPLRTVHPRPYLTPFASYIFHPETKKWLDTMVWSSAQPHSVNDMVQRCFKERVSELKAVWARDTLGLSGDEYHKKTQTTKDLEKPWAELSALPPLPNTAGSSSPELLEIKPPSPPTSSSQQRQHHSAKTTLLVDDSPLKAILQPWNHLCIREYVQDMRRLDLAVADWQWSKAQAEAIRQKKAALENGNPDAVEGINEKEAVQGKEEEENAALVASMSDPNVKRIVREVVMVDGQMVNTEEVLKRLTREVAMIDGKLVEEGPVNPEESGKQPSRSHQRRKLKRMGKREAERKEREEREREAFLSLSAQMHGSGSGSASATTSVLDNTEMQDQATPPVKESAKVPSEEKEANISISTPQDEPQYDLTLLAVVGILDHLKHEENVAGWMRSGGLLHIPAEFGFGASSSSSTHAAVEGKQSTMDVGTKMVHTAPSRGYSPSEFQGPSKRRRVDEQEKDSEVEAEMDVEIQRPPSALLSPSYPSPPPRETSIPPPSSPVFPGVKIIPASPSSPGTTNMHPPSSQMTAFEHTSEEQEAQASTGVPTSAEADSTPANGVAQALWYEHPAVLSYWAERGRSALQKLGIAVESGIERVPGGLQQK